MKRRKTVGCLGLDYDGHRSRGRDRYWRHDAHGRGRSGPCRPNRFAALAPSRGDLHRLADWFAECGVTTVVDGIDRRLLDPDLRTAGAAWLRSLSGQCPRRQARAGSQDRRQRRVNGCSGFIPTACCAPASDLRARSRSSRLSAPARAAAGLCSLSHPAYAESPDGDESSTPSRRVRYHWRDRHERSSGRSSPASATRPCWRACATTLPYDCRNASRGR